MKHKPDTLWPTEMWRIKSDANYVQRNSQLVSRQIHKKKTLLSSVR